MRRPSISTRTARVVVALCVFMLVGLAFVAGRDRSRPAHAGANAWTMNGLPTGLGVGVQSVAIAGTNPSTVFVVAKGNLFISTDGGTVWRIANDAFLSVSVVSVTASPSAPQNAYVGTSGGFFKSTNAGQTWTPLAGLPAAAGRLWVSWNDANLLHAATDAGSPLYRSTDGGANWTTTTLTPSEGFIISVAVDAVNPNLVYATVKPPQDQRQPYQSYLFRTTDGGQTWIELLPNNPIFVNSSVCAVQTHPQTTGRAWFAGAGARQTIDGGDTWQNANGACLTGGHPAIPLAIDYTDPSIIYFGWNGTDGPIRQDVDLIAIDPTPLRKVYFIYESGVYFSTVGGSQLNPMPTGGPGSGAFPMVADPASPGTLYALTDGRIARSVSNGATWTTGNAAASGLGDFALASGSTLYAAGGQRFHKSTNAGASWSTIWTLPNPAFARSIAVSPTNPLVLYGGANHSDPRIYASTNGGASFTFSSQGLPTNETSRSLAVDAGSPSTVYVLKESGIFKSVDGGATWTAAGSGVNPIYVNRLTSDPVTPGVVYAWSIEGGDLVKTVNGGASWTSLLPGLPGGVEAFAIDPANAQVLYASAIAAGRHEVYRSINGGAAWTSTGLNLNSLRVYALAAASTSPTTLHATLDYSGFAGNQLGGAPTPTPSPTPTPTPNPNAVQLRIQPPSVTIRPGASTAVALEATIPGAALGTWEVDVAYSPSSLSARACTAHADGVCVIQPGGLNLVRFTGTTGAGLTGTVTLGTVTFQATTGSQTTPLTIQVGALTDTGGGSLPSTQTNGSITGSGTPIPDANGDGIVNATDSLCILRQIGNFAATSQCPIPLPFGDVNLLNNVDAVDSLCVLRYLGGFPPTTNCPSEPPGGAAATAAPPSSSPPPPR